jgi:iron(III) transport system permease protein
MTRGAGTRAPLSLVVAASAVVALLLMPLVYLVFRVTGGGRVVEILGEEQTWRLVWNTVLLALGVVVTSIAVAVPLAWLVTRTDLPARRVWATAGALPFVIPSYVAAFCLLAFFGERGILAGSLGVERLPDIRGYWGSLLALTLATYPYVFLLAQSSLRGLDPSLEEAARGLGSTPRSAFFRVTAPALRPAVGLGALLVALYTLSDFGVVSLMDYDTLTRAIYVQYKSLFDRAPAATLALVLVALTGIALVAEYQVRRRGRLYRTGPGTTRPPQLVPLGRWTVPALGFCSAVVGLFLVLPAGVLAYWLSRGVANDRDLVVPWSSAAHSLVASGLAATAAVLAALPVAVLAIRYPTHASRLLERLSYAGNALPGLVIALSLVFFAARYASPVYQTLALLVFAYVVRFFPQGLSGVESAFEAVSPRQEEAARSLGTGSVRTFTRVTLPLVRSGMLAGAALVFLSAMKELPATLLLRPIGFETLATDIWTLTQVGAYSSAAVPALVLVAVSAPVLYLVSSERRFESGTSG